MRRACRSGKCRFRDEFAAEKAMARARQHTERARLPIRVYECTWCAGWHLTSRPDYGPREPLRTTEPAGVSRHIGGTGFGAQRRSGGPRRPRLTGPTSEVRALVLDRDGYCCVRCGASVLGAAYNLQHRIGRGSGGSTRAEINTPPNLVVMCGSPLIGCHGWATAYPNAASEWGWVLERNHRPPLDPADHPAWVYGRGWVLLDRHGGYHPAPAPYAA